MTTHPANDGNPSWSHDGRWIYFDSNRTGQPQVFKVPSTGGEPVQVTYDGASAPLESPDSRFLYYTKALGETSLWKMPTEGGPATKILDGLSSYMSLAITGDGVYFVPMQRPTSMRFFNFADRETRPVIDSEKLMDSNGLWIGGLAVSPDGRSILFQQIDEASELVLVENFH